MALIEPRANACFLQSLGPSPDVLIFPEPFSSNPRSTYRRFPSGGDSSLKESSSITRGGRANLHAASNEF
jgi:hypothetical protein